MNKCITCNRETDNQKFCSRSCSAKHNNSKRKRIKNCKSCGTSIDFHKTFCNNKCQMNYQFNQKVELWLSGETPGTYKDGSIRKFVKQFLINEYGEKCSQCGWNQKHSKTGKVPIEVDHIDGNWNNNSPENLRLLCPNCHSLTATYKALNEGSGRPYRQKHAAVP